MMSRTYFFIVCCIVSVNVFFLSGCKRHSEPVRAQEPAATAGPNVANTREAISQPSPPMVGNQRFDGAWWSRTQSDERRGFLAGYLDCYVDDQHHALNFDKSWAEYESLITKYYSEDASAKMGVEVGQVITKLGRPDKRALQNPHEDFGDEWWRQDSHSARLGFVTGYFACRAQEAESPHWSQSPEYYVAKLDDLYNVDDRKGFDAPEYPGSIASALLRLADDRAQE